VLIRFNYIVRINGFLSSLQLFTTPTKPIGPVCVNHGKRLQWCNGDSFTIMETSDLCQGCAVQKTKKNILNSLRQISSRVPHMLMKSSHTETIQINNVSYDQATLISSEVIRFKGTCSILQKRCITCNDEKHCTMYHA
jgi:hypothetical protein